MKRRTAQTAVLNFCCIGLSRKHRYADFQEIFSKAEIVCLSFSWRNGLDMGYIAAGLKFPAAFLYSGGISHVHHLCQPFKFFV